MFQKVGSQPLLKGLEVVLVCYGSLMVVSEYISPTCKYILTVFQKVGSQPLLKALEVVLVCYGSLMVVSE